MGFCMICGAKVEESDKFCRECGAKQNEIEGVERVVEDKSKKKGFHMIWYVFAILLPFIALIGGVIFYFQDRKDAGKLILASVIVWVIYAVIVVFSSSI